MNRVRITYGRGSFVMFVPRDLQENIYTKPKLARIIYRKHSYVKNKMKNISHFLNYFNIWMYNLQRRMTNITSYNSEI